MTRCGHDGGHGIGAGHVCRCVRSKDHALDDDRPHGCECGALWAGAPVEDALPEPVAPSAHELVVAAKALRTTSNRLDLVRERLVKDRIHHGIFGDEGSRLRVESYEAEERELRTRTIALVQEVRARAVRVRP